MRAIIRLATAQPSRVAESVLDVLTGGEGGAGSAWFESPDALRLEGDADYLTRAFEAARGILDLPPRILVERDLEGTDAAPRPTPAVEERLYAFARIAAARHAPKARFELQLGEVTQLASAWLRGSVAEVRRTLATDLGPADAPFRGLEVALGHGDSRLVLDWPTRVIRMEARDTGALEALEFAQQALDDLPPFLEAVSTFEAASATPSEAAERERTEVEASNLARRTGHHLLVGQIPLEELLRRVGVGRVRAFLEGPPIPPVPVARRAEALGLVPGPGRARAIVRLVLDGVLEDGFDPTPWLDALAAEPAPAATAGFEELLLAGVAADLVSARLAAVDPTRAARALARAAVEGDEEARERAATALLAMGPEVAAESLTPPPTHRLGLEACWEVVRRLLASDQGGLATGRLLTRLFHETMKLAEGDPAARFLAGHIARARGDLEGAAKYFDQVAAATQDRALEARARLSAAFLHFEAGRIEEAMSSLARLARQASGAEKEMALERLRECYRRLDLPDFAAALEPAAAPDPRGLDMVDAWLEARAGHFKEAAALFQRVDQAAPVGGEVARSYAAVLRAATRDKDALELLETVCARDPGDAESFYQLARLHHEGGDLEACHAPLEGALRVDPRHSRSLHLKGLLHEREGRYEEAARCFERAIQQSHSLSSAYSGLARSYIATARYQDAAAVYRRSLDLGPECRLPAYRELGILYEGHLQDFEKALFWYQRYLTHGGEDGEVLERYKRLAAKVNTYPKSVGRGLS